jgi:hypothetical protein
MRKSNLTEERIIGGCQIISAGAAHLSLVAKLQELKGVINVQCKA